MRQPALARDPFVSDDVTTRMAEEVRASLMAPALPPQQVLLRRPRQPPLRAITRHTSTTRPAPRRRSSAPARPTSSRAPPAGAGRARAAASAPKARALLDAMGAPARCGAASCSTSTGDRSRARWRSSPASTRASPRAASSATSRTDVTALGPGGRRLIAFLGSTIGNLHPDDEVPGFLAPAARQMADGDGLLLGVDLVKDTGAGGARVQRRGRSDGRVQPEPPAGDERAAGRRLRPARVRARRVLRREAAPGSRCACGRCRTRRSASPRAGLTLRFDEGDELRTEISCKYTR